MIERLDLSESQHLGYDKFCDERAVVDAKETRFIAACLLERGGRLTDGWQFDKVHRVFWRDVPDAAADTTQSTTGA